MFIMEGKASRDSVMVQKDDSKDEKTKLNHFDWYVMSLY